MNPQVTETSLAPVWPKVIMDINMGAQAVKIGFDYDAFYRLAKDENISDDEISRLTIHFAANTKSSMFGIVRVLGDYAHDSRTVNLYRNAYSGTPDLLQPENPDPNYAKQNMGKLSDQQRGDVVMRHEIGHWVDVLTTGRNRNSIADKIRRTAYRGGGILALGATIALPVATKEWVFAALPLPAYIGLLITDATISAKRNSLDKNLEALDPRNDPVERPAFLFEARTRNVPLLIYEPREL